MQASPECVYVCALVGLRKKTDSIYIMLYCVDEDYPAGPEINEPLFERSNWLGSESSSLEIDVYIWRYTLKVVYPRNEWVNKWMCIRSVTKQYIQNMLQEGQKKLS